MLNDVTGEHYGLELSKEAGLPSGTIYPMLARLEKDQWVVSRWEDVDPSSEGRPRKRLYQLTGRGARLAREHLSTARELLSVDTPARRLIPDGV